MGIRCFGVLLYSVVFFFKQKTAYEMRISDWSSDVCSSDLPTGGSVDVGVKGKPVVIRAGVEIDYYPVLAPDHSSGKINPGPTGQYLHPSAQCCCLPLARDGLCYGKAADGQAGKPAIEIRKDR